MHDEDQAVLQQLKWSVQALAATPEVQLKLFPEFVCKPDELVLDFDQAATVWRESLEITREQLSALESIDATMDEMPPEIFTDEHVRTNVKWERLRQVAVNCLAAFGWPRDAPPEARSTYVPG